MEALAQRFWSKVLHDRDGCWEWQGARTRLGYGQIRIGPKMVTAHRVALMLAKPSMFDPALDVLHTCDNPRCCRPGHLWQGTHADNMADRDRKRGKYQAKGERAGPSKLTDEQARAILNDKRKLTEIAVEYGVCISTVSHIRNRRNWKWL
jgi:hypothetical protein